MIIAVANLSASFGTSNLAIRLAAERAHVRGDASGRVLLVTTSDTSPSHECIGRRVSASSESDVLTAVLPSARALQTMVPRMAQDYDDIVIDVPGINTPAVRTALVIADVVMMPVALTRAEADASGMTDSEGAVREFVMTVDMARHYNHQLRAVAVADGSGAPEWLVELLQGQTGWQLSSTTRGGSFGSTAGRSAMRRRAADPVVASVA